jgi:putative oxidoreductase
MNAAQRFCKYWHHESQRLKLADAASLLLRLWLGISILSLHGWGKLQKLLSDPTGFPDPLGLGVAISLGLAVWAEFFCSMLIIAGFATRPALTQLMATMLVAFFFVHGAALSGPMSGEMAFTYLGGFTALFLLGPGRLSIDHMLIKKW